MTTQPRTRRAALYLRQSVTRKDGKSVSLQVQEKRCRAWCESQGYQVVAVERDPDTSGSKVAPELRAGYQALQGQEWDVLVVYKIDRIARDFLAFFDVLGSLEKKGRTIASVSENLDLGSPIGKSIAGVFAGLAEQTALDISERVADTRQHLIRAGRVVGGKVPYGWRSVPNPAGKGFVLAQNPDTIGTVRGMVARVQRGDTLYAVMQWLHTEGVAVSYSTVERMVRHPILAGMTPFNPGNEGRTRGDDVLRGEDGLPVVREDLAVMPVADWRAMVADLDARDSAQSRPRSACAQTSSLLSGLVWCGEHDEPVRMHRGTTQGRPHYQCSAKGCYQTVSNFEDAVVEEFLRARGDVFRLRRIEVVHEGGAALLPEIEHRLDELDRLIRDADRERRRDLQAEQAGLLDLRDVKRAEAPSVTYRLEGTDQKFARDWAEADDVEARRAVLDDALAKVTVTRGAPGRRTREQLLARLAFEWRPMGQVDAPSDEDLARLAEVSG